MASRAQPRLLLDPVSSGQPLRARISGAVKMTLRNTAQPQHTGTFTTASEQPRKRTPPPVPLSQQHALLFEGPVMVSGVRVNSLGLVRQLTGQLGITGTGKVVMRAMGASPSPTTSALAASASIPTQQQQQQQQQQFLGPPSTSTSSASAATALGSAPPASPHTPLGAPAPTSQQQSLSGGGLAAVPGSSGGSVAAQQPQYGGMRAGLEAYKPESLELEAAVPDLCELLNLDPVRLRAVQACSSAREWEDARDSRLALKGRGGLMLAADVYNAGAEYRMQVANLPLDDLEAGSLRGALTAAAMEASMEARQGRASFELNGLRYASLNANSFSSSMRWEGDVVKLEETVLTQANSMYELSGEVFLPDAGALPTPQATLQRQLSRMEPNQQTSASRRKEGAGRGSAGASTAASNLSGGITSTSPPTPHEFPFSDPSSGSSESSEPITALPSAEGALSLEEAREATLGDRRTSQQNNNSSSGGHTAHGTAQSPTGAQNMGAQYAPTSSPVQTAGAAGETEMVPGEQASRGVMPPPREGGAGRWRLAVNVPHASVSDLLPATQLMSALNSQPGADYGTAKLQFLQALRCSSLPDDAEGAQQGAAGVGKVADELRVQVDSAATAEALEEVLAQHQAAEAAEIESARHPRKHRQHERRAAQQERAQRRQQQKEEEQQHRGSSGKTKGTQRGAGALPGLQELSGKWSGRIEVFGIPAGATNIDFALRGEDWRWGASSYRLDRLVAAGNADSSEGLAFEELSLTSGPATCVLRGSLLGARQEASLHVADFPLDLLAPLQQALPPALQGALSAAEPKASRQSSYMRPFSGLARKMENSLSMLGAKGPHSPSPSEAAPGLPSLPGPLAQPSAVGPVSGLMYIDGHLGGSSTAPEAQLDARLTQGAIGGTRLAKASAQLLLDAQQRAHCALELSPADMAGHLRVAGNVQLKPPPLPTALGPHSGPAAAAPRAAPPPDLNRQATHGSPVANPGHVASSGSAPSGTAGDAMSAPSTAGAEGASSSLTRSLPAQEGAHARAGAPAGLLAQQGAHVQAGAPAGQASAAADFSGGGGGGGAPAAAEQASSATFYGNSGAGGGAPAPDVHASAEANNNSGGAGTDGATAASAEEAGTEGGGTHTAARTEGAQAGAGADAAVASAPEHVLQQQQQQRSAQPQYTPLEQFVQPLQLQQGDGRVGVLPSEVNGQEKLAGGHEQQEDVDVSLVVSDGGMALISALVPGCEWQSGSAAIDLRVHGTLQAPGIEGGARLSRGMLKTPFLRSPVQGVGANLKFDGRSLTVDNVEARVGRHGSIKARGRLPLHPGDGSNSSSSSNSSSRSSSERGGGRGGWFGGRSGGLTEGKDAEVVVDLDELDLRLSNLYTGVLDASLSLGQSLSAPNLGGWIRFSRGTLFLLPQSSSTSTSTSTSSSSGGLEGAFRAPSVAAAAAVDSSASAMAASASSPLARPASTDADMVTAAFSMLKAGRKRSVLLHHLGAHTATVAAEGAQGGAAMGAGGAGGAGGRAGSPMPHLAGLKVMLGPDFRAVFPVVLNVAVSGQVSLSGPPDPLRMQPSGTLSLDGGALNLVATQFMLDREHANRITFQPELGLDPVVDVLLLSGDLRAAIQGRGSTWQEGLTLSAAGTPLVGGKASASAGGAGGPGNGSDARGGKSSERLMVLSGLMEPPEVARVFEERLAEALLGENGQLALRSLASSTFSTLLPKIETHGQLGAARWRLVGAPSLPNLLGALDALAATTSGNTAPTGSRAGGMDPAKFLSSLAACTELDLVLGKSLTASLAHKLLGDSKIGTEATFTYSISEYLRLQLQLQGLARTSLLLGYNSAAS